MQLQPVDDGSICGAIAALGSSARDAQATWVARDAVTAKRAPTSHLSPRMTRSQDRRRTRDRRQRSDAQTASDVVRRYASQALGLPAS